MKIEKFYIECQCNLPEHRLVLTYFPKDYLDDVSELYISQFLDNYWFLKRLVIGIKYIFGYKSQFGHFNGGLLDYESAKQFRSILNTYIKEQEQNND